MPALLMCVIAILAAPVMAQDYETLFQEAERLAAGGQYPQAIAKYQAALRLRPAAPEALNNLAVMLYATHQYAEALETSSPVWRDHPQTASAPR